MRSEKIAMGVLVLLAIGLVVAALSVIGGPVQRQLERRDAARLDDLHAIRSCLEEFPADRLATLASSPLKNPLPCDLSPSLADPYTQEPYTFREVKTDRFALCAKFERLDSDAWERRDYMADRRDYKFDRESGCLTFPAKTS